MAHHFTAQASGGIPAPVPFDTTDDHLDTCWWSFGDGTTASSEEIGASVQQQHTYTNNGNYTVVLGVTYGVFRGTNSIQIKIAP